ncbi:M56 family metallopeptidase [Fodinibius halophilus]|uniref:M56 family metallopeptidase n=1 Tax=Fodinibius halophilus TaxID=1736908 RepID=A0A6M1TIV3_9BACT|nr:M56 family metallopeptidase [Fodinibius halophilus]NGP88530.1 M56 family metallopeptidase [Fodinibius halophilus]
MTKVYSFLYSFGDQMLDYVWFPLLIWTVLAIPFTLLLKWTEKISPVYQYHCRIGLQLTLPLGIIGAALAPFFTSTSAATQSMAFIVVKNPLPSVSAPSSSSAAFTFSDPMLWVGLMSVITILGALFFLAKMLFQLLQLKKMELTHHFRPLYQCRELVSNLPKIDKHAANTLIAYSKEATIPYTYGWRNTKIVIPADLKSDSDALCMAVQHELMHIKHNDFLFNTINIFVRSLFWFHPLLHYLYNSSEEYREITCDNEVLAQNTFSKKQYASLLYELAQREYRTQLAMSMAVNPSSLKKRIKILSDNTNFTSKLRTSFLIALTSAVFIVLAISCTDMTDGGITKPEVNQAQDEMQKPPKPASPLYVINGEQWTDKNKIKNELAGLKTKYIKSIDVLKGDKAKEKYGKAGESGVIEIQINNPDKAFTDLKDKNSVEPPPKKKDHFVAVEKMPELIGGLASLQKKIDYPEMARKAGIEGRVIVQFIVNEQGQVENPQVIRGIGGGADKEALRVIKQAKFKPGTQQDQKVRVQYSLPITFRLQTSD